jgi:hypothetical protein
MNAYELAQCLEDMADFDECEYTKAANMLRQQADRIAELEAKLSCKTVAEVIAKHEAIPSRKEAIDNAREWLKNRPIELVVNELQTKPLSDEEIKQIWYDLYPLSSSSYWDDKREGIAELKFARAIEERHGIK